MRGRRWTAIAGLCLFLATPFAAQTAMPPNPRTHENFDAAWKFHLGEVADGQLQAYDDSAWRTLDLPHDWSVEADFSPTHASATAFLPGGIGWYRRSFDFDPQWAGKRVLITFDGIYRNADVWINGHPLGQRPYGYITFQHDLTAYLLTNRPNVLAVRVARENIADSRWYPGSGIYRHVWLTTVAPVHVPLWGTAIRTPRVQEGNADVVVATEVTNGLPRAARIQVAWQIVDPDGNGLVEFGEVETVPGGSGHTFSHWQKVQKARLWGPESPALYTLKCRVFANDELVDETSEPFGIRSFYFDANRGFFLNGQNLKLKGVCMHHDAGVVGAAVPDDMLERRLRLIKEFGGNAVRCSHNPMAPELYSLCDKLGLLVMDEAFDEWELGKRKWVSGRNVGTAKRFGYSVDFEQWAEEDCADMVRRGRNHPSIIMWSIGNEIDYPTDPYVLDETRTVEGFARDDTQPQQTRLAIVAPRLIAAIKRNDPTRPVTMALANLTSSDATGLAQMLDIVGYNYQEGDYARDHRLFPTRVIYGSENGKGFEQWQYVRDNDHISAQFLWTGFDFLGEAGEWPNHGSRAGLFDTCGFPKTAAFYRQALWAETPMVYPVVSTGRGGRARGGRHSWNWPENDGRDLQVQVYSNCEEVQLTLNGKPAGTAAVEPRQIAAFRIPYQAGTLRVVGLKNGQAVCTNDLVTTGPASALRVEVDRKVLIANNQSIAHATLQIVDAAGHPVQDADNEITVAASGAGKLLGVDNGDLNDPTPLRHYSKAARGGKCLAILQAGRTAGTLTLTATAKGLADATVEVQIVSQP